MKAVFLRLTASTLKEDALLIGVEAVNAGRAQRSAFSVDAADFGTIPGAPFGYWCPRPVLQAFEEMTALGGHQIQTQHGVSTCDDFRFVRLGWEVAQPVGGPWMAFAKGGAHGGYYADISLLVRWGLDDARELETTLLSKFPYLGDNANWLLHRENHYGSPGLTWPRRTSKGLSVRALPRGCYFGHKGPAMFVDDHAEDRLLSVLAFVNTSSFRAALSPLLAAADTAARSYELGPLNATPFPAPGDDTHAGPRARRSWSLKRSLDTVTEASHAFHLPALLQIPGPTVADRAVAWAVHLASVEAELANIQAEIDDIAFRLYGIDGEDRARIEAESGTTPAAVATYDDADATAEPDEAEPDDEDDTSAADTATLATELLSWSIGVAFGRFDLRHATGELPAPVEPGPFDPLPARSPGMCPDDALAVEFLVDDPGHPLDLSARIADVFAKVFPADHEARLDEVVRLAGSPDLSTFLRRTFFPFHLKRYSKSRRKAPIWWPLSTASGTYTVWLAWPRLTRDTLFRVADEIKRQKLPFESRKLASLKQEHGPNPTTRQRTDIVAQEDLVSELTALLEEVERVAPMWNPVHDDGVILHYALLWRVVRDAAWQKECRAAWDKLAKGDYDWAHIAMHLWPERVAPKCRTDRSLAIAHGLEDTFWVEIAGKWRARDNTDAALATAIAERSSAAVKAALRAFTDAPAPGRGGRGKKGA